MVASASRRLTLLDLAVGNVKLIRRCCDLDRQKDVKGPVDRDLWSLVLSRGGVHRDKGKSSEGPGREGRIADCGWKTGYHIMRQTNTLHKEMRTIRAVVVKRSP